MGVHDPRSLQTIENVFDLFCSANTMHGILSSFSNLCSLLGIHGNDRRHLFQVLQAKLSHYWKAKALFAKLSKRAEHKDYGRSLLCHKLNALIIGGGPCGLRTSIELALLGANVIVLEKRDKFSRNNVLHLWPFLIDDLRSLGAKKFFGKFCFGSIDHISIRTLQCILLKVALIFGVRVVPEVEYEGMVEPTSPEGFWRVQYKGRDLPFLRDFNVNVVVGADGKRNTLPGFRHKQFRARLAIAITVNFLNKHTQEEALVQEISGLSYIFNQKFFLDLKDRAGIDLENIVYYKDETHYFVMTAKKSCLISKGVLRDDHDDPAKLLDRDNINKDNLLRFAREAAVESTVPSLPHVDFALNQYGQPDVAVFDFTSLFAAENASRVVSRHGKELLMCLVGDSLLEPFWPTGSGCARGFLGAFDAAWMVRRFGMGKMNTLELIAERESIYQRLSQTESDKMNKNYCEYSIDPRSRYPGLDVFCVRPRQVTHLFDTDETGRIDAMLKDIASRTPTRLGHLTGGHWPQDVSDNGGGGGSGAREPEVNWERCLRWFQIKLNPYDRLVEIRDLSESWFNGVGLLCLIHLYRPDLVELKSITADDPLANATRAFNLFDSEFSVAPLLSPEELVKAHDQLTMCSYLEQVYETLRMLRPAKENRQAAPPKRWSCSQAMTTRSRHRPVRRDQADLAQENVRRHQTRDHRQIQTGLFEERAAQLQEALIQDMTGAPMTKDAASRRSLQSLQTTNRGKVTDLAAKLFLTPREDQLPPAAPGGGYPKRSKVVIPEALRSIDHPGKSDAGRPRGYNAPVAPIGGSRVAALAAKVGGKAAASAATQSSSDRCYFCGQQVYLVERMTAEGYFFHRGCLKCAHCGTRLRLSTYVFHRMPDGRGLFYCFAHYAVRHAGEVPRDLYDYFDDQTLFFAGGGSESAGAGPSEEEVGGRNNNFRTPERAEFQYYAEELREVDEESICDYNRLSIEYLEDEDEEEEEEEEENREVFSRRRKFSWENAVEVARRMVSKRSSGTLDDSSTDFDSTSLGLDLGSDSDAEERAGGPAALPQQQPSPPPAPVIQRDTAAKQKFYMEAPKPLHINPRSFFAKCNLQKLRFTELHDPSEAIEELSEPEQFTLAPIVVGRPSAGCLRTYGDASPIVGERSSKVTCTDYFAERWEACCEDAHELSPRQIPLVVESASSLPQAVVHVEDTAQHLDGSRMNTVAAATALGQVGEASRWSETRPALPNGMPNGSASLDVPLAPLTFADLSDIHDIDSSSVPTENSCASEADLSIGMPTIEVDAPHGADSNGPASTNGNSNVSVGASADIGLRLEDEGATSTPDTTIPYERTVDSTPLSPWANMRVDDEESEPPRPSSPVPSVTPDGTYSGEHRCLLTHGSLDERPSSRGVSTHSLHTSRSSSSCSLEIPDAAKSNDDSPKPSPLVESCPAEPTAAVLSPQEKEPPMPDDEAPVEKTSPLPEPEPLKKAEEALITAEHENPDENEPPVTVPDCQAQDPVEVPQPVLVEEKVPSLADPEPELQIGEESEEHIYENLPPASTPSKQGASVNSARGSQIATIDSAAESSLYLASSHNDDCSKSSLPLTDSTAPSNHPSPSGARVVRRRKRRVRKVKGGAGQIARSVDSSQADTSTTGDEEGRGDRHNKNRMSVPLLSRWKEWFSSSSEPRRLKGRHSSMGDLVEASSGGARGVRGVSAHSTDQEVPTAEFEELRRQEKRRRQLARERELFEIQCQLEEVDARLRQLEDRGVLAEQTLRKDAASSRVDQSKMTDWLALIHEKNELLRVESELTVSSKELELTYRQECLEEQYRQRMMIPDADKTPDDRQEEERLLHALVKVVEERDALVSYLEDIRQREQKKENDVNSYMGLRGGDEAELSVDEKLMLGATQESKLI